MMDSKEILKLILPEYLVEHFNITKVKELNSRLDIYFEEKNDYGHQLTDRQLISKGFYPMTTIEDFPLRGKSVKLHVQRRRWTDKQTEEIIARDWNMIAEGTRMTKEFSEFLKKISRY
ncbi:transposase [Paenimyroides tangerinum]|uniref:Transposase n=1 Tax=Paenimyroides tangerinum TaxID=2488728 RepID=A0A3P3VWZ8_9FLAO|nr:transposase [Paenimyroides tangerinum]RRJ86136.1 transposase [Paenimyroides tangerinum]